MKTTVVNGSFVSPRLGIWRTWRLTKCRKCGSNDIMVGRKQGWERVLALLTRTRKYRCRACGKTFRAPHGHHTSQVS